MIDEISAGCLPVYWYSLVGWWESPLPCTEILRLRPRMTSRAGRKSRNVGSFLRKELGGALRNTENLRKT